VIWKLACPSLVAHGSSSSPLMAKGGISEVQEIWPGYGPPKDTLEGREDNGGVGISGVAGVKTCVPLLENVSPTSAIVGDCKGDWNPLLALALVLAFNGPIIGGSSGVDASSMTSVDSW
jgi:hypothetical protein